MSEYKEPAKPAQFESPAAQGPQRKGMSGCVKTLIIALIVGAIGLVVCCGIGWFVVRPQAFTTDPARVDTMANTIITMDIPSEWNPEVGIDFLPFYSVFRMAIFSTEGKTGFMVLMDFQGDMGDVDQARGQMETSMQQGFGSDQDIEKVKEIEQEERKINIRGEEVPFTFTKSEGLETKQIFWEVAGLVKGNERPTLIYVRVPEAVMTQEQIEQMLQTIK